VCVRAHVYTRTQIHILLKGGTETNIMLNLNNLLRLAVNASECTESADLLQAFYADKTEETHKQREEVSDCLVC